MTKPETEKLPPMPELPDPDGSITIGIAGRYVDIDAYRPSTVKEYARAYALAALRAQGGGESPIAYGVGLGSGKGGGFVYVDNTYEQARLSACHCADKTIWPLYTTPRGGATPDAAPDGSLRAIAKRNLASLIRIGSDDKELMLKCLEELS